MDGSAGESQKAQRVEAHYGIGKEKRAFEECGSLAPGEETR